MKNIFITAALCFLSFNSFADEGMWLPFLLEQSTIKDMQAAGCRMSAEDIYSVNQTSLKDGILLFNGGCTGEMISGEGLLLTNHHCGFGYVQEHSSIENDYVKNGFWAMNKKEEFECAGLSVTFIVRMEDVTDKILKYISKDIDEKNKNRIIDSVSQVIIKESIAGTKYAANVRPIYYGNQYILIISQVYRDVRLVGAPPENIGNFGGDDENWMWPRHTGDFSLFRIYADKNNEPAEYSEENIPYKPKYFFTISIKGVNEGDFAMVYGFPGRTTEYITSYAVDFIKNVSDPDRVKIRTVKLNLWMDEMQQNDTVNIQYAAKYSGIANGWKKWQGEMLGLNRYNVAEMKRKKEDSIMQNFNFKKEFIPYSNVIQDLKLAYDTLSELYFPADYYAEALNGSELISFAQKWLDAIDEAQDAVSMNGLEKKKKDLLVAIENFYKDYNPELDKRVTVALFKLFVTDVPAKYHPDLLTLNLSKFKNNMHSMVEALYNKNFLSNKNEALKAANEISAGKNQKIAGNMVIQLARNIQDHYTNDFVKPISRINSRVNSLNQKFMHIQLIMNNASKKFYPDANSTLRVAYGNVKWYYPVDAVKYKWFTTADGIIQKNNPNSLLYAVPEKLLYLIKQKDFGQYASADGNLNSCFITTCHTTGGNSGSPVIDADGNLIGTNFDRVWEGTMSDIYYNPDICRNVSVDIRYTLFLIDKFAGAGYLINEMNIIRQ